MYISTFTLANVISIYIILIAAFPLCLQGQSNLFSQNTIYMATAVAQWLRYFSTNRKVASSIPDGVIGIFH
jgi:hypothetical protein